jgi:hypothetical protein
MNPIEKQKQFKNEIFFNLCLEIMNYGFNKKPRKNLEIPSEY